MEHSTSMPNERVWCITQRAKLSFNHSIRHTHSWRFQFLFCFKILGWFFRVHMRWNPQYALGGLPERFSSNYITRSILGQVLGGLSDAIDGSCIALIWSLSQSPHRLSSKTSDNQQGLGLPWQVTSSAGTNFMPPVGWVTSMGLALVKTVAWRH